MVGAGLFGFLMNPPNSLYYVQGLNLTPLHLTLLHGHTALFGVYGMLGLGLTLFCLRALRPGRLWKRGVLKLSFWSLNVGLTLMSVLSLLPVWLLPAWASIQHGTWYARSAEFMQSGSMQTLRWMRVSPHWLASDIDQAEVSVRYPASRGYVLYRYRRSGKTISLDYTSCADKATLRVPLPQGSRVSRGLLNGQALDMQIEMVTSTAYATAQVERRGAHSLRIELTSA